MKKLLLSFILFSSFSLSAQLDSAAFEGVNGTSTTRSYVSIPTPSGSNLRLTSSYTVETLIFIPLGSTGSDFFAVETYSSGSTGGFVLRVSNGYVKGYQLQNQSSQVSITGSTQMSPGIWNHLALTFDETNQVLRVFLNGVQSGSIACGINTSNSNPSLNIGARGDDNAVFSVIRLDEVRIWNYARTASELSAQMNSCLNGNETGLLAYYNFEGDITATVTDKSGNGNNGTINNFSSTSYVPGIFDCQSTLQTNELKDSEVSVFPNPTKDFLTVSTEEKINEISLMDATGKIVKTVNQSSFSVAELKSGIYFLTILTENGIAQRKFIKE